MNTPPRGRVWVIDGDADIVGSAREALESAGFDLHFLEDVESFFAIYEPAPPECVLLDLELSEMGGLSIQRRLKQQGHLIPLVFLTAHPSIELAVDAMRSGARDYLTKPVAAERLEDSLRDALAWSHVHDSRLRSAREASQLLARLTPREQDVLQLVLKGLSSKQIAELLKLSRKTIDVHRSHIAQKLGVESLAELIRLGLEVEQLEAFEALEGLGERRGRQPARESPLAGRVRDWSRGRRYVD